MNLKQKIHSVQAVALLAPMALALVLGATRWSQEEEPVIVSHMKGMNTALRSLRRQLQDPAQKEANLRLIGEAKQNGMAAREEQPLKTPDIPQSEQEAFLNEFRTAMDELIETLGKLEEAVRSDQLEEAQQILRYAYDLRKNGHDKFQQQPDPPS